MGHEQIRDFFFENLSYPDEMKEYGLD